MNISACHLARPLGAAVTLILWVVLLATAPLLPDVPAALLYVLGGLACHQLPERSFYLGVTQLPVCARCLGIYAGAAGAALVVWTIGHGRGAVAGLDARHVLALAGAPTAMTVALEWVGWWHTSNLTRLIAGVPLGVGLALVVGSALATLHYGQCPPRPPAAHGRLP